MGLISYIISAFGWTVVVLLTVLAIAAYKLGMLFQLFHKVGNSEGKSSVARVRSALIHLEMTKRTSGAFFLYCVSNR